MAHLDTVPSAAGSAATAHRRRRRRLSLAAMFGVIRQRRALAGLDAHLLDDIGVSRADAAREAARPGWDIPGSDIWRA